MTIKQHAALAVAMAAAIALTVGTAFAQSYPVRPVRLVTSEAGGGNDFVARLLAPGMSEALGQQLIIDNRGSNVAAEFVHRSPADGYTLLHGGPAFWLVPFLRDNPPFDPLRDFAAIGITHVTPNILVVHPSLPAKTVKDLIALAKARPSDLNFATAGYGGQPHMGGEMFKLMTGVNIVSIPYKGASLAVNSLIGGEVHMMFATVASAVPHVKSGRLKALAVTTAQPSALFPELPTVSATVPGYELTTTIGVFARSSTPPAVITRLNQEMMRVLAQPDVKEKLLKTGSEPVPYTPEQTAAYVKSDYTIKGKIIQSAGIKAN